MPEMPPPVADAAPGKTRTGWSKVILGVVVAVAGFVLLLALVSIFAVPNAKNTARDHLIDGAKQAIDASSLSADEKKDALAAVREFLTKAVADKIPADKLDGITREIMASHYGRLLAIMAAQHAVEKSALEKDQRAEAQENIQILLNAFVRKLITDAELAPVIEAIPKDKSGQPARQPWNDADLDAVLARAASIGGPYAKLCRLAAIPRAIDKSALTTNEKAGPLENARVLSDAYFKRRVSDAELAPVLDALPKDPKDAARPAKLPWEKADLDKVMSQVASVPDPAGKLMQVAAVGRAIAKAKMTDDEKAAAQKNIKKLSAAYIQNLLSDAEIEPVLKAIPKDLAGPGEPPPRKAAFEPALSAAAAALKNKEPKPDAKLPNFPDEIRRVVKMMKDASAAADAAIPKPAK